ncbi:MAG: hypothetical protein ACK40M_10640 [Flavobacteriales bacterium]
MKSILTVTFFAIATHICFAQTNFTFSKSEPLLPKNSWPKMFFGCIGDNFYFVESIKESKGDNLTILDKEMKVTVSEPLVANNANKQIIKPLILWNKIYMLSLLSEKGTEQTSVHLEEYDAATLKYLDKNTEILNEGFKTKYFTDAGQYAANWHFTVSPDSSKIAFLFYKKEIAYVTVLDKELKQVWSNSVSLDKNRISASVSSVKLLNNGEVFLLFSQAKGNDGIDYTLYCVTNNGGSVKSKDIPMDNQLFECALFVSKDSKPYLTGMYKKLGLQKPEGIFYHEIDMKTAGFAKENKYKITSPIWPERLSQKQRAKAKDEDFKSVKDLDKYRHKIEIIELSSGEYYFIIEQYKRNHAASANDVDYSYDNVYVCYVNSQTGKSWDHLLAKSIRTNVLSKVSYISYENNGDLYLIYNDRLENLDKTKDTEISEYFYVKPQHNLKIFYAKYNKEGFVEKKQFDAPDYNGVVRGYKTLSADGKSEYILLTRGTYNIWESTNAIWRISVE